MAAAVRGWMLAAFYPLSSSGRKAKRLKGLFQAAEEQPHNPDGYLRWAFPALSILQVPHDCLTWHALAEFKHMPQS